MRNIPKIEGAESGSDGGDSVSTPLNPLKTSLQIHNKSAIKRLKDVEICVPIVYGSISFWLGKKASEIQSHKWTVYVRGARNEDLGVVIKRVVFQLHPSFKNPVRVVVIVTLGLFPQTFSVK